jgi:hypothetical protein
MSTPALDTIMRQIRELTPEELRQVRQEIDHLSGARTGADELRFVEALQAEGLLANLPLPDPDPAVQGRRRLAQVTGEPVSETLVAERR